MSHKNVPWLSHHDLLAVGGHESGWPRQRRKERSGNRLGTLSFYAVCNRDHCHLREVSLTEWSVASEIINHYPKLKQSILGWPLNGGDKRGECFEKQSHLRAGGVSREGFSVPSLDH